MLRYRLFRGSDAALVEKQVNTWLMNDEPDVRIMDQAIAAGGEITVGFLYSEGFKASEERLTVEATSIVEQALQEQPMLEPLKIEDGVGR